MNMFTYDCDLEHLVKAAPKVKRVIMAHGIQSADAEDIVQEALISAAGRMDRQKVASIEAWFMRIAMNKMKDYFRRKKREERYLDSTRAYDDLEEICITNAPEDYSMEQRVSPEAVRYALSKLPPRPGAIFTLCYIDGLKWKEIARRLGTGESTVRSLVHRYKGKFAEYLKEFYEQEENFIKYR